MKIMKTSLRLLISVSLVFVLGAGTGVYGARNLLVTEDEKTIVEVVKKVDPAVVSVIVSKDVPIMEQFFEEIQVNGNFKILAPQFRQVGTENQQIGGGTAFFISHDGMLLTNTHVVTDTAAQYSVVTNTGQSYPVRILQRVTELDLALLKVDAPGVSFPVVPISGSVSLDVGQTVLTIGNALGEFRNTISKGIISGIGRNVVADTGQFFDRVIQTDAAVNLGGSGGPLLNTSGELIGVVFSTALGAQNISFAVPLSDVKTLLLDYDENLLRENNPAYTKEERRRLLREQRSNR